MCCLQVCCPHHDSETWPIPSNPQIWRSKTRIKWSIHWPDNSKSWNRVLSILCIWLTDIFWNACCISSIPQCVIETKKNKKQNPRLWGSFLVLNIWEKQEDIADFSVLQDSNSKNIFCSWLCSGQKKLFSLTFEMMYSKKFRATFLGSQCPFMGHRAWKS